MTVGDSHNGGGAHGQFPGDETVGATLLQETKHLGGEAIRLWALSGSTTEGAPLGLGGGGEIDLDTASEEGLLAGPTAWLFGSEAHGLPDSVISAASASLRVPIYGRAESLNLAAAAAVCLYASASAQRRR